MKTSSARRKYLLISVKKYFDRSEVEFGIKEMGKLDDAAVESGELSCKDLVFGIGYPKENRRAKVIAAITFAI